MKFSKKELLEMVESVVKEVLVNEAVFKIDSNDSDMKQKIEKIKSDNTI